MTINHVEILLRLNARIRNELFFQRLSKRMSNVVKKGGGGPASRSLNISSFESRFAFIFCSNLELAILSYLFNLHLIVVCA